MIFEDTAGRSFPCNITVGLYTVPHKVKQLIQRHEDPNNESNRATVANRSTPYTAQACVSIGEHSQQVFVLRVGLYVGAFCGGCQRLIECKQANMRPLRTHLFSENKVLLVRGCGIEYIVLAYKPGRHEYGLGHLFRWVA